MGRRSFLKASLGWMPDALNAGAKLAAITTETSRTPGPLLDEMHNWLYDHRPHRRRETGPSALSEDWVDASSPSTQAAAGGRWWPS